MEGTGSIDKAIDVLELVAEAKALTAAEIASSLGLPAPTAYRLLRAWQRRGYIIADESRRFTIGSKLLQLSSGLSSADLLRSGATPILQRLAEAADVASAQIAIFQSDKAVFIALASRPQDSFRIDLDVGSVVPLHSTALGKALIGGHAREKAREIIGRIELPSRTPATIVDANRLEEECAGGLQRGYWTSIAEHAPDLWSVATTIPGAWDRVTLAVGVSEHMWRFSRQRLPVVGREVLKASQELASLIGGKDAAPIAADAAAGSPDRDLQEVSAD